VANFNSGHKTVKFVLCRIIWIIIIAGNSSAVANYMSTKLIYYCGSQSEQPCIAVINRRSVCLLWVLMVVA